MDERSAVEKLKRRYEYNNNFNKENYDRISLIVPKGTKDRIAKAGLKASTIAKELLLAYLDEHGF